MLQWVQKIYDVSNSCDYFLRGKKSIICTKNVWKKKKCVEIACLGQRISSFLRSFIKFVAVYIDNNQIQNFFHYLVKKICEISILLLYITFLWLLWGWILFMFNGDLEFFGNYSCDFINFLYLKILKNIKDMSLFNFVKLWILCYLLIHRIFIFVCQKKLLIGFIYGLFL